MTYELSLLIFLEGALINGDSTRTFCHLQKKLIYSWRFAAFDPETVKLLISLFVSALVHFLACPYTLSGCKPSWRDQLRRGKPCPFLEISRNFES